MKIHIISFPNSTVNDLCDIKHFLRATSKKHIPESAVATKILLHREGYFAASRGRFWGIETVIILGRK
ncbi:MAG: hypothetical protein IKY79_00405 [Bacteroidales bacterium]|nr:hypothetical protein [Bacteroidales bacterium]